jgi:hypothetical protein
MYSQLNVAEAHLEFGEVLWTRVSVYGLSDLTFLFSFTTVQNPPDHSPESGSGNYTSRVF